MDTYYLMEYLPVGAVAMLPQAEPPRGRRLRHSPPRELHSRQDAHVLLLRVGKSLEASDGLVGDDERVVVLGLVRVVAPLHPEGVG